MTEWKPELAVPIELAKVLIESQFPPLRVDELTLFGEGWDNVVYRVNAALLFRFPRRQIAVDGVQRELRVLPYLAGRLPVPIPSPAHVGRPSDAYPWPFFGFPFVPGREACDAHLSDDARTAMARPLAAFLHALHEPGLLAPLKESLPVDPIGRADMASRIPKAHERLDRLERLQLLDDTTPLHQALEEARGIGSEAPLCIVHGDLHFRHILLDDDNQISGVIDWGDVHAGDPSVDLQLYWSFLPARARPLFVDEYGTISRERLLKARVLAIFLAAALAEYGHMERLRHVEEEALGALVRAADAP